jgi:hypothetical protein
MTVAQSATVPIATKSRLHFKSVRRFGRHQTRACGLRKLESHADTRQVFKRYAQSSSFGCRIKSAGGRISGMVGVIADHHFEYYAFRELDRLVTADAIVYRHD